MNVKKIKNLILCIIVGFSFSLVGCAGSGVVGGFIDSLDKSAVSVLGYRRISLLEFGNRERQLLEKDLLEKLDLNESPAEYNDILSRTDGTYLMVKARVGKIFTPTMPVGLSCRRLGVVLRLPSGEIVMGSGVMCIDTLAPESGWKRYPDIK